MVDDVIVLRSVVVRIFSGNVVGGAGGTGWTKARPSVRVKYLGRLCVVD